MKQYPSISSTPVYTDVCMFQKYDGSNIRVEWTKKRGFHKFGSRSRLIDETDKHLGKAILCFRQQWEALLEKKLQERVWRDFRDVTFFFEYMGYHSFAGQHVDSDTKELFLIDVNPYKKGILDPRTFIQEFGMFCIAKVIGIHKFNKNMEEVIRNLPKKVIYEDQNDSELDPYWNINQEITEGVVCKYKEGNKIKMFKVKTNWWKEELKKRYEKDWEKYL